MKKYAEAKISRRKFLSGGALLGAGAVATLTLPATTVAASKHEPNLEDNKKEEGYRLTQHIADYYKSAAL